MDKRQRIMVVDDDKEVLKMLSRTLELEGFDVRVAEDGGSALMQLAYRPDLIILDIMMPGMDGLKVLDLIRRQCTTPVIMLTARAEVSTLHDAIVLGADDYVRKPFRTRELVARVRAKLRRARQCLRRPL